MNQTPPKPDGYRDDAGNGLPSHVLSRRTNEWIARPSGHYRREEGWPSHVLFRGEWVDTPTIDMIEEWDMDGGCETPDGDWVEPDHPRSWQRLLRLI